MEKEKKTLEDKALDEVSGGLLLSNLTADAQALRKSGETADAALASAPINGNFVPGK